MGKVIYADNAGKVKIPASVVFPDATEQTTKGHPMRWTLNKLLLGAGLGANPTEITPVYIATGSYTGDDNSPRQITVGFQCGFVILVGFTFTTGRTVVVMTTSYTRKMASGEDYANYAVLHGSDGFTVGVGADNGKFNDLGILMEYVAVEI